MLAIAGRSLPRREAAGKAEKGDGTVKNMINRWRPYMTVLRLRALMETQYRAAALGGLVTQVFFGLVYIFLYTVLFDGSDPQALRDTIT